MLNPVTFQVEGESGPMTVVANGLDYAAYEDTFDRSTIPDLAADRYKTYAFIVWHAMKRQGLTDADFPAFLAAAPEFKGAATVADVPPLESKRPTGS